MDKVTHFELHADDLERAQKFYKDIFGWDITNAGTTPEYHLITTVPTDEKQMPKEVGAINGGMQKRASPAENTVIVINVADIDGYLQKIEQAGGKVVNPKTEVMNMGLYARVTDTEGNIIGIWQDKPKA